jgi:hypothetical protein
MFLLKKWNRTFQNEMVCYSGFHEGEEISVCNIEDPNWTEE